MNCHTTTAKSEWRLTMVNNRLTRKQRAAVVRRQKITLAAGIAVLILVIIFVLAFKGCNSKKKNNDKTVPANTETTTDDNKTATENNSENIKSEETQDASTSSDNSSDYSGSQYADSQSVSSKGFSIQTINGITYVDGVLIANKTYSLPSDFIPQDPEVPVTSQRSTTSLDRTLMSAWRTMQADASSQGLNIYIASAYRSYSYQVNLYNSYVARDGKAAADTYSSRPGNSEHQTGLCFDLNSIDDSFGDTAEGRWVNDNCYKYGFCIRFPKGKDAYTGYQYESWHLRYVGKDLAEKLYNNGAWISLEEYFGITSEYPD
jgi:D-alanyl-D-alanine carboxypeptidase